MGFDKKKFGATDFAPRTDTVDVSHGPLADFFGEGEDKFFKVRGLDAKELAIANDALAKKVAADKAINEVSALAEKEAMVKALTTLLGVLPKDTPAALVKSIEMIHMGAVDPKLEKQDVVKIAKVAPTEFALLSLKITELTGLGAEAKGKRRTSGKNKT